MGKKWIYRKYLHTEGIFSDGHLSEDEERDLAKKRDELKISDASAKRIEKKLMVRALFPVGSALLSTLLLSVAAYYFITYTMHEQLFLILLGVGTIISLLVGYRLLLFFVNLFIRISVNLFSKKGLCYMESPYLTNLEKYKYSPLDTLRITLSKAFVPFMMIIFTYYWAIISMDSATSDVVAGVIEARSLGWIFYMLLFIAPAIFISLLPALDILKDSPLAQYSARDRLLEPLGRYISKVVLRPMSGFAIASTVLAVVSLHGIEGFQSSLELLPSLLIPIFVVLYVFYRYSYLDLMDDFRDELRSKYPPEKRYHLKYEGGRLFIGQESDLEKEDTAPPPAPRVGQYAPPVPDTPPTHAHPVPSGPPVPSNPPVPYVPPSPPTPKTPSEDGS